MWALVPLISIPIMMILAAMEGNFFGAIGIFIFAALYCWPLTVGVFNEILVKLGLRDSNPYG